MDTHNMLNPLHYVYLPTIKWKEFSSKTKSTNIYLIKNHHKLSWEEGKSFFCQSCIYSKLNLNDIYYVVGDDKKLATMQNLFPQLKLILYKPQKRLEVPANITCPYKDHGEKCAYLKCLKYVVDYVSCC